MNTETTAQADPQPTHRKGRGGDHGQGKRAYAHLADAKAAEAAALAEAHFASVLKLVLHLRGLEYVQVAPVLGISPGTLADKLNGRSPVSIGQAAALAAFLGLRLSVLIDRETPVSELLAAGSR